MINKKSQKLTGVFFFCLCFTLTAFIYGGFVCNAARAEEENYYVNIDQQTAVKGYAAAASGGLLKLSLPAGALTDASGVEIKEINEETTMPWQLNRLSKIYQFELLNKAAYDNKIPLAVQLNYEKATDNYKQIFYYDKNYDSWRPLPSKDYPDKSFVRSQITLPFARLAVFENPNVLTAGKASWYKYKAGNFAASPDFPKGSRLRVYNAQNNKFVDVEINDYGPERTLHPDRVVDLEKRAFAKIAPLSAGTVDVRVEPLYITPEAGKTLGIAASGAGAEPRLTAKSAIVINEESGEEIFALSATSSLPLASLTKLVAVKVFLDTRPTLSQAVAYSAKDEEYNYQYVDNKYESARLKVKDGETLTAEDLIYASLVGSANNTVETLVRTSGLTRDNFIKKMNETIAGWGASSTHFVEPTGLSPENVSTAADYAIITKEAFTNPIIQKASVAKEYKFSTLNTKKKHRLKNTNPLIAMNRFKIAGSKTGYLEEAGYCLMSRVETKNGEHFIAVVMGAPTKTDSLSEMEELLKYAIKKAKS